MSDVKLKYDLLKGLLKKVSIIFYVFLCLSIFSFISIFAFKIINNNLVVFFVFLLIISLVFSRFYLKKRKRLVNDLHDIEKIISAIEKSQN